MKSLRLTYFILSTLSIVLLALGNMQDWKTEKAISFTSAYTLIPLFGGILGLIKFHFSDKRKKYHRNYIIAGSLFSCGILFWAFGSMIWTYFYMNKYPEPPFPSVADIFYFSHGICWMFGILVILRELKSNLLSDLQKISPYIILLLANSYILLFQGTNAETILNSGDSKEFTRYLVNLLYTLVDIANISLIMIFVFGKSFMRIQNEMRVSIVLIAIGLFINYMANLIFGIQQGLTYQHPIAKFIGAFIDYLYAIEFILLALAIFNIPNADKIKTAKRQL